MDTTSATTAHLMSQGVLTIGERNALDSANRRPFILAALGVIAVIGLAAAGYTFLHRGHSDDEGTVYAAGQAQRTVLAQAITASAEGARDAAPKALALAIASGIGAIEHVKPVRFSTHDMSLSDAAEVVGSFEVVRPGTVAQMVKENLADERPAEQRLQVAKLRASTGWTNRHMFLKLSDTQALVGYIVMDGDVRKAALLYADTKNAYFEFRPLSGIPGVHASQLYTSSNAMPYSQVAGLVAEAMRAAERAPAPTKASIQQAEVAVMVRGAVVKK